MTIILIIVIIGLYAKLALAIGKPQMKWGRRWGNMRSFDNFTEIDFTREPLIIHKATYQFFEPHKEVTEIKSG
jgi:hypothetical protein